MGRSYAAQRRIRIRRAAQTLTAACLLLAGVACSRDVDVTTPPGPPRPRWIPDSQARQASGPGGISWNWRWRGFWAPDLTLPQAGGFAHEVPRDSCAWMPVHLDASDTLRFRGESYPPAPDRLVRLLPKLKEFLGSPPDGACSRVAFRCDRTVPWRSARQVIAWLSRDLPRFGFDFQARYPGQEVKGGPGLDATTEEADPAASNAPLLAFTREGETGPVIFRFSAYEATTGPVDPLTDDAAALARANAAWDGLEAALKAAPPGTSARLSVGDAVPWAYAAQGLELLYETGRPRVTVEGLPSTLRLSGTPVPAVANPWEVVPRGGTAMMWIGAGAAIAAVVVLWGLRRRRPTSRPPPAA